MIDHGVELSEELARLLGQQDDGLSLMLRYRPDLVAVLPGTHSVLCEAKSCGRTWVDDFSLEARAFRGYQRWAKSGNKVMILRHTRDDDILTAGWLNCSFEPGLVLVPRRDCRNWEQDELTIRALFPRSTVRTKDYTTGSGTPYFWMPSAGFMPLDVFAMTELVGPSN